MTKGKYNIKNNEYKINLIKMIMEIHILKENLKDHQLKFLII